MWAWIIFVIAAAFTLIHVAIHFTRTDMRSVVLNKNAEVLIVFAHPDDETMFFLPLLLLLQASSIKFRLLCLSTGNYDGIGLTRVKELKTVGRRLGATSCDIVDDSKLQDGPHFWPSSDVSRVVKQYLSVHSRVNAVFTFDDYGVSGHPNHVSVHRGIVASKLSLPVYVLKSVALYRKYIPLLDGLVTLLNPSESIVAVNIYDPLGSLKVMRLYASQNVWFRKLFSLFSKYSYLNEFNRI